MIRNELDVLLDKVKDDALRADLRAQIDRLRERRSFGLVFERHIPERVRLPQSPIRVGVQVVSRDGDSPTWEVVAIENGVATIEKVRDPDGTYLQHGEHSSEEERATVGSLVVITDFGEPVLPGFRYLDAVERGGDKPYHVVINGENHHALEALRFTHAGKIDCIYIDPPYNSGARDWKYDNDYVDENDAYRHSKWLAFMERRLKLAKELLNPDDSVLIVTIDEKEYLRLGLLLEQTFPNATMQMVSNLINPKGTGRANEFNRVDEYLFFLWQGEARLGRLPSDVDGASATEAEQSVPWDTMRRRNLASIRGRTGPGACGPNQFYAIHVDEATGHIVGRGSPLPGDSKVRDYPPPAGTVAVFPIREDGTEMNWSLTDAAFDERWTRGYVRAGKAAPDSPQPYLIQYLSRSSILALEGPLGTVTGRAPDGSVVGTIRVSTTRIPRTQWMMQSHNAEHYGTALVKTLLGGRAFPFPKSLYAVEDTLRLFLQEKTEATVLDFFAGSGTTAHAVARLNRQDGGRRQSIMVTNNEVSADEAADMRRGGLRPGDPEWEGRGVFAHITRPRVEAAITGRTPEGQPIPGDYKFIDEFPMADGFAENAAFLELRYLDADDVDLGLAYEDIAPLLWLRAGAQGPVASRTDKDGAQLPFIWTERYGVLFDEDRWRDFVANRPNSAATAFVVTYSPTTFAGVVSELPSSMDIVRLYDTYLSMYLLARGGA